MKLLSKSPSNHSILRHGVYQVVHFILIALTFAAYYPVEPQTLLIGNLPQLSLKAQRPSTARLVGRRAKQVGTLVLAAMYVGKEGIMMHQAVVAVLLRLILESTSYLDPGSN